MPNAEHFGKYLEITELALLSLLALRLAITGLRRSYPVFFAFILFQIPHGVVPLVFPVTTNTYLHIWVFTQPIVLLLHVLLVAELCRLILAGHPGIYSLGKWAMYGGVGLAVVISILSLLPHLRPPKVAQISNVIPYFIAAQRGIDFGLGIFLLLMMAFLSRFPFRLNRNTLIHAGLYTFFFFTNSLGVFLWNLFGIALATSLSLSMTAAECCCLAAWLVFLSPKGEGIQTAFPTLTADREQKILDQLDALNSTLLRASGRK